MMERLKKIKNKDEDTKKIKCKPRQGSRTETDKKDTYKIHANNQIKTNNYEGKIHANKINK